MKLIKINVTMRMVLVMLVRTARLTEISDRYTIEIIIVEAILTKIIDSNNNKAIEKDENNNFTRRNDMEIDITTIIT